MTAIATREQAKQYLASHRIPQMFESLLSCLMIERPEDPVSYVEAKMAEIKKLGVKNVNWETFIFQLHPLRDPVRRQLVRDGSKFDKEYEQEEKRKNTLNESKQSATEQKYDSADYEPDVFQLTET